LKSEEQESVASAAETEDVSMQKPAVDRAPTTNSVPARGATRGKPSRKISLLVIPALLAVALFAWLRPGADSGIESVYLQAEVNPAAVRLKVPARSAAPEKTPPIVTNSATPAALTAKQKLQFQLVTQKFLPTAELTRALGLLEQQGYQVKRSEKSQKTPMTRLLVGTYSRKLAERRLIEVREHAEGAFLVAGAENKFDLYAGSFASLDRARRAADRLYQRGIRVEERRIEISLPQTRLSFGQFASREQAAQAAALLHQAGLVPVQIQALTDKGSGQN